MTLGLAGPRRSALTIPRAVSDSVVYGPYRAARPQLVGDEARTGYLVGNHTWSHPDLTTLSATAQAA